MAIKLMPRSAVNAFLWYCSSSMLVSSSSTARMIGVAAAICLPKKEIPSLIAPPPVPLLY